MPAFAFSLTALFLLNTPAMAQQSAYKRSDNVNSVVYRGYADSHIWELSLSPGSNWQRNDLFASCNPTRGGRVAAAANPMGYVRYDKINAVVYAGTDQNIYELALQSGKWCPGNLSTNHTPAAPAADSSASPWGYVTYEKTSAVVYRGSDHKIYQLTLANDGWHWMNLFYWTPSPVPPATDPVAYVTGYYHDAVVYIGTDKHVHQLEWFEDGEDSMWGHIDLTQSAGAPPAAISFRPTGFVSQGTSEVAYTGVDGHVYVLYWADGQNTWLCLDANANSTTQGLALTSPVSYQRSDGYHSIVYGGNNYDIWELYSMDGIHWGQGDVSATAGGAGWIGPGDPAAYLRSDGYNSIVYTEAFGYYFQELTLSQGGYWQSWSLPYAH
jgi:hypothetical protein